MNEDEFRTWARRHAALFPEAKAYLYDAEHGRERCQAWCVALAAIDLEAAQQASVELLAGGKPQAYQVSDIPRCIVTHAQRITAGGDGEAVDRPYRDEVLAASLERIGKFRALLARGLNWDQACDVIDGPYSGPTPWQSEARTR